MQDGKTVFDFGSTVFEDGKTVLEGPISVSGPEKTGEGQGVSFTRGSLLLDTYRMESDPIEGGMGSVWKVHHLGWNTDLAMKRPKPDLFADEDARERFIHECQSWINLGLHPNIVSCYYVREIEGVPTIFSEWMENGSLENRIEDGTLYGGTETEQQARLLDIAIQYARGLRYAHSRGLIHQDVKPDNLLLTNDWQAKAADFGLAQARAQLTVLEGTATAMEDAGATRVSGTGAYTPAYCSMEQMDGKKLTRATDVYSWGISVMEMFYGSRPWNNGVVAGMSCREYFEGARVHLPDALRELLAKCLEMEAEARIGDFGPIEAELLRIYEQTVGKAYSRPRPEAALDDMSSLNNRAISYLDIGKEQEAAEMLKQCAGSRHFDGVLNLALYRWRKAEITGDEMLAAVNDLEKIYGDRKDELEDLRRQIREEACGSSAFPEFRTASARGMSWIRTGGASFHDGKLILVMRKRMPDDHVYNYVCHFDPDTGKLLAQYPPEGEDPKILFTMWEGSLDLTPDGSKMRISSRAEQTQGIFDVIRQKRINQDPFAFIRPESGDWMIRRIDIRDFYETKDQIRQKYQDGIPLTGSRTDADYVHEVWDAKAWRARGRAVARYLFWLRDSLFLIQTKKDELRLWDVKTGEETLLLKRGRKDGATVLKSASGQIVQLSGSTAPAKVFHLGGNRFLVGIHGRFFTLPELQEVLKPDWQARGGRIHPRTVQERNGRLAVAEAITGRELYSVQIPAIPHESYYRILTDFAEQRLIVCAPGSLAGWAVLDLPLYPETLRQMNYRVSVPVSSEQAQVRMEKEQRLLNDFKRAEQAQDRAGMIALYREAIGDEGTGFKTLHAMNRSLSARCTRQGLIRVMEGRAGDFAPRKIPETNRNLSRILAFSPSESCFVYLDRDKGMINRCGYPSGRVTHELRRDRLPGYGNAGTLNSLCIGRQDEIYVSYQCESYSSRLEDKKNRIVCLGRALDQMEIVLEEQRQSSSEELTICGATEDGRYLVLYGHPSWKDGRFFIELLDLRQKKTVQSFDISDIMKAENETALEPDAEMRMLKKQGSVLELLWDYLPKAPEKPKPRESVPEAMRVHGNMLEEYYGEAGETDVVIPAGIEDICSKSFMGNELIRSVTIPEGVKYIGSSAFRGCKSLEKVVILSHSLSLLDSSAFEGCAALREFSMAENQLHVICKRAFYGCKNLETFSLPESVRKIQEEAFRGTGLKQCGLPSTLEEIGECAFAHAPLEELELPEALHILGKGCFMQTHLRRIRIPAGVTTLPEDAFDGCWFLEEVLNDGSILDAEPGVFSGCRRLRSVQVARGFRYAQNIFSDGLHTKKDRSEKKRAIRKETTVRGMEMDAPRGLVPFCTVQLIPVSPEGTGGPEAATVGGTLDELLAEMENLARKRMGKK